MTPGDDSLPTMMAETAEPLLLLGAGNRITAANLPALDLTGYAEPALVGAFLQDVLPAATDEGRSLLDEHLAAAGAGACRQFAWQLQDAGGNSSAVVVTVAPLEAETLLVSLQPAQSKDGSPSPDESLLDSLPFAAFTANGMGAVTYTNTSWQELLGTAPAESAHSHLLDFISGPDRERAAALLHQAAIGTRERLAGQFDFLSAQGSPIRCALSITLLKDDDGAFLGFSGTLQELGEQMRLEEQLRELQDTNRALEARIPGEQLLQQQARWLSLMAELARGIAAGSALDELSAWLLAEVNATLGSQSAQLWRHEPARDLLVLVAAAGPQDETRPQPGFGVPAGLGTAGAAVARGRTFVIDGPDELLLPDIQSAIAIPIMTGDKILGALEVQSVEAGTFDDDVRLLLEALASQLAVAMESSRLRAEMSEQLQELTHLQQLTTREAWVRYRSESAVGMPGYRFDRRELAPLIEGRETARADNGSAVHLPLFVRGERIGALGVVQDENNPLTVDEQRLLEVFSTEVAEALDNARLLEQTQKRAVELETVSRVSAATSTILETDQLLQAVVELTKRSFGLYHAHIYLLDPERGALVLAAGAGTPGELMVAQGWHIPVDHTDSVVARAAQERTWQIVNDVLFERSFLPNPLLPETRAELAVPMIVGNRLVGVLDVQADRPNAFSREDAQIQMALANQIASALQNATLYQEQLSTAEQLREFDRLKSEFLASMSHELRTPLNSIIGFADVLLEGIDGELNERMEEDVRLIRNSGEHLRNLIGDILDMSKIEAGMMDLRYEAIDVAAMGPEIRAFARTQMMTYDRELDFELEISPEVELVHADRTRFRQVIFNLLSNAIKFTNEGRVGLRIARDGDNVLVAVEDSGIGIDEQNLPIVFEQFRQVDGSLTRTAGGTGLGLPISKSLVEMHGGKMWVKSIVDQGTTFYFSLPVKPPSVPRRRSTGPLPPFKG